jgi:hypothetical protein
MVFFSCDLLVCVSDYFTKSLNRIYFPVHAVRADPAYCCNARKRVDGKDFKALRYLKETEPQSFQRGIVLYTGREMVAFAADMFAVPLSM